MHPTVGEVDLHSIYVVYFIFTKMVLDGGKDGIYIRGGSELNLVFGYVILGQLAAQFADLDALVCQ